MSIYSGFATRQQEEHYDQLVDDLIFVLQKRLLKFYNRQEADESKFVDVLQHLHSQMHKMEEHKYLEPKTSRSFGDLLRFLGGSVGHGNDHVTPQKGSGNTAPMRTDGKARSHRSRSHRDSFSQNHEPTVGKIIHQIPKNNGE